MDIAGLSMHMSQQQLSTNVGIAVLDKSISTMEDAGAAMVKMMEQSVNPSLGQNIDIGV